VQNFSLLYSYCYRLRIFSGYAFLDLVLPQDPAHLVYQHDHTKIGFPNTRRSRTIYTAGEYSQGLIKTFFQIGLRSASIFFLLRIER
jgi:hypothetical protein